MATLREWIRWLWGTLRRNARSRNRRRTLRSLESMRDRRGFRWLADLASDPIAEGFCSTGSILAASKRADLAESQAAFFGSAPTVRADWSRVSASCVRELCVTVPPN